MNPTTVLDASCVTADRTLVRRNNSGASPEEFSSFAARHTSIPGTGRWQGASPSDAPSVQLVVAFSGHSALDPVLDAHQMIYRQLRPTFRVEESWWNFHALTYPSLRDFTVADAARADIILVALHTTNDPHWMMLRDWVDAWSGRRMADEGALVLLLPASVEENGYPGGVERYLREAARVAQMDFFVNAHPVRLAHQHLARHTPAVKQLPLSEPARHWGINE